MQLRPPPQSGAAPIGERHHPPPCRVPRAARTRQRPRARAPPPAASTAPPPPEPPPGLPMEGTWAVYPQPEGAPPIWAQVDTDQFELVTEIASEALLEGLDAVDAAPAPGAPAAVAEVPSTRLIVDSRELDLIGDGLPIIHGEEWPEVYWNALTSLAAGREVPVPAPHPKFTAADMARIAASGPAFSDLVLEHAERVYDPGSEPVDDQDQALGEAYSYIPTTVMGDYRFEPEPSWLDLRQGTLEELFLGVRQRNWTAPQFRPASEPWRVQFFQCGYRAVSDWPGWRAVVTPLTPDGVPQHDRRWWADMPLGGPPTHLHDHAAAGGEAALWTTPRRVEGPEDDVALVGFNQVFEQVFQAFEQRLPRAALREFAALSTVTPGRCRYDCPGEALLDVSWHPTANDARGPWAHFLIRPSLKQAVEAVRWAVEESGVHQLREARDSLLLQLPPLPQITFAWNPNNAGPLYFLICLTAGVVIPALRRGRILDITTLEEDPGAAQEFARSKATARKEGLTGVEFGDVAGLAPIMGEVIEVVEFLRDPRTFSKLGARPPKGILFEGDPGTGKTLLAKALAGEAMVPFYQMSGTEFTEGIVGLGAARVRDLFKRARVSAPCIIFVDELDALGLKRASGEGGANEEREQTLNQLLTEMDGFTPDTGVVFLGATNRADLLDPALMRPGRFDRKVRMPKPDTEGRYEILQLQLRGKEVAPDVDLLQLARDLPGLVGADLANIINEAQLNAVRAGRKALTKRDIYAGVDRFTQGELRPSLPTGARLPALCFASKEVGMALVATLLRRAHGRVEQVERVSIQPKGRSTSRTLFARGTDEDYTLITRGRLMDRIRVALAGSIAVRVALGEETNFAIADIQRACRMADKLVYYYGMSDWGITTWAKTPYSADFAVGVHRSRKVVSSDAMDAYADWPTQVEEFRFDPLDPSDVTWHRYTDVVRQLIKQCYEEVWRMLEEHRDALWAGVQALVEARELLGSELRDVFDEHPPRALAPEEVPRLDSMVIFTSGRKDTWPYGIEWLDDAYERPYWVRKQMAEVAAAAAAAGGGGGGADGGGDATAPPPQGGE